MNLIYIIFILIIIYLIFKNKLKIECYNFWHSNKTSKFYNYLFDKVIEKNSSILDVGVGTGINLVNNKKLILDKNLNINGIDIDKNYNKYCKNIIKKNKLEKNIIIELKNLFDIDDISNKYKYIVFGQSYPVISKKLITKMVKYCKNLLQNDGKIIFIHNLIDNNKNHHIVYKIKPYLKYIPFIWIDSGKPTKKTDFEKFLTSLELKYNYSIIDTDKILDIKLNIYLYICELN